MIDPSTKCYIPGFKVIGISVLEKILKGFYHKWARRPSWSCDPDTPNKTPFPQSMDAPNVVWLSCLKIMVTYTVSGNRVRVRYHLCIRHTLGTVFEQHQSSETVHRYFYIIKTKSTYRPSYAA